MEVETQVLKENGGGEGEDIYETIEAPKFVDFTAPDKSCPDDRYWFCSRFGCDQKHEEELDAEAIYKNFVMRVMAARSPNVRFRKAPRNAKGSLTAPPKSSKSRLSKLALISSVSKRIVDSKVKAKPLLGRTRITRTPTAEAKQSFALNKALTTPRNGKRVSIPRKFLSVRNVKGQSVSAPKTLKVVKSLVFNSPKKSAKIKANELNTPMRTLCAAMKKLDITNGHKYESLTSDAGKKKPRGREVKSRVFDSLYSHKLKGKNVKLSSHSKRKSKEKLSQNCDIEPKNSAEVKDDSIDMDMDDNSRHGSNGHEDLQKSLKASEFESDKNMVSSTSAEPIDKENESKNERTDCMENVHINSENGELTEIKDSDEDLQKSLKASEFESDKNMVSSTSAEPIDKENESKNERTDCMENVHINSENRELTEIKDSDDKENVAEPIDKENESGNAENGEKENTIFSDDKENVAEPIDKENESGNAENGEKENTVFSDDKENVAEPIDKENERGNAENGEKENTVFSDNRKLNPRDGNAGRVNFGKHDNSKTMIKVKKALRNPLKENSSVAYGGQGLKNMKPKPTYPKPFRLRTDERGILREANMMEKKIHRPSWEMATSEKLHVEKPQKMKKNCLGECGKKKHIEEEHEKKSQAAQLESTQHILAKKTSKAPRQRSSRISSISAFTTKKQGTTRTTRTRIEKSKHGSERSKTDKVQEELARHHGKEMLSRAKEASSSSRLEEANKKAAKTFGGSPSSVILASSRPTPRQTSRKRTLTVPKAPNFHNIHVPKSCTRKLM